MAPNVAIDEAFVEDNGYSFNKTNIAVVGRLKPALREILR